MASTYKILGQVTGSTENVTLYTTPTATQTVASSLVICNRAEANSSYRVMALPSGSSLDNQHYLAYDVILAGRDTIVYTIGISLNQGDKINVYSSGSISFTLFGAEVA